MPPTRDLAEDRKTQLSRAQLNAIGVDETRTSLLFAVYQDFAVPIDFFQLKVATIENYLSMMGGTSSLFESHVIARLRTKRRYRLRN